MRDQLLGVEEVDVATHALNTMTLVHDGPNNYL